MCSGGLEPHFRVLFSAIFHGVSPGISIRVESYGIERKKIVVNCSQSTYKIFGCVFEIFQNTPESSKSLSNEIIKSHANLKIERDRKSTR